jgi:predicted nucleic acid-binding protein
MRVYFDASLLVSLHVPDDLSARAEAYVNSHSPTPMVSDFAAAEFASSVNRFVRMGILDMHQASAVFSIFDTWRDRSAFFCKTEPGDVETADALLRRLDLPLRTPDALNIAVAQRLDLPLATFDIRMARSAEILGLALAPT